MKGPNPRYLKFFVGAVIITSSISVFAQQIQNGTSHAPIAGLREDKTPKQTPLTFAANAGQDSDGNSDNLNFGSVGGRVVYDANSVDESQKTVQKGVAGVKVMVRRVDNPMGNFFFERLTNADGTFDFQNLRPGRYTVQMDRATLPTDVPLTERRIAIVDVAVAQRLNVELYVPPQRTISGIVFVDEDGDGIYQHGKDKPVEGASVSVNGNLVISTANGSYVLRDLPSGRVGLLVNLPKKNESSHIVLDIASGPVTNRVVNIPVNR